MNEKRIRNNDQRQWLAPSNLGLLLFDDNGDRIKQDRRKTPDRRLNNISVEEVDCGTYISKIIKDKLASNDYEASDTIRQYVRDELCQSVSDESFSTALQELHSRGYVTSHIYDKQSERYALIISPEEYSTDVLRWRLSE